MTKIKQNLLILLCNVFLLMPSYLESTEQKSKEIKITIQNYTTKNSFASELKKNFSTEILNKKLAESEIHSSPSKIKPRKGLDPEQYYKSEHGNDTNKIINSIETDLTHIEGAHKISIPVVENVSDVENITITKEKNAGKKESSKVSQKVNLEGGTEIVINSKNVTKDNLTPKLSKINLTNNTVVTTIKPSAETKIINIPKTTKSEMVKNNTNSSITQTTVAINITTSTKKPSTTTTSTTTTTPKPKKPKITYSMEDNPAIAAHAKKEDKVNQSTKLPTSPVEEPIVQPVREDLPGTHRDYILPIVAFIFAVPILMGIAIISYRRFKDYWSTRHYRRMDFLVDGMYNE